MLHLRHVITAPEQVTLSGEMVGNAMAALLLQEKAQDRVCGAKGPAAGESASTRTRLNLSCCRRYNFSRRIEEE